MPRFSSLAMLAGFFMPLLLLTIAAFAEGEHAEKEAVSPRSAPALEQSSGEYMGHQWHIDGNHLMWWDGKPYVRFGFTGVGDPTELMKHGFSQFTLMPEEEWPISGPDPEIVRRVDETSDELERIGATYYGILNAFWPWRYGNLITESDQAKVFVRDVGDVTEHAGREIALEVRVQLPIGEAEHARIAQDGVQAILFDLEHSKHHDLTDKVKGVTPIAESDYVGFLSLICIGP